MPLSPASPLRRRLALAGLAAALVAPLPAGAAEAPSPALAEPLAFVAAGELDAAVEALETIVAGKGPAAAEARSLLGAIHLDAGRPQQTVEALGPLAAPGGEADPVALFNLGQAYLALGRPAEAEPVLRRALAARPEPRFALPVARLLAARGAWQDLAAAVGPALAGAAAEGPDDGLTAELSFLVGRASSELGRPTEAIPHLQRATRLAPEEREAWQRLGEALTAAERLDEAYEALTRARELEEADRVAAVGAEERAAELMRAAISAYDAGQLDGALAKLREAKALVPQNPAPWVLEVRLLIDLRRAEEALAAAGLLVEATGGHVEALHLRGMSLLALDRPAEAEADFRAVLAQGPHRASMNALALVLIRRGERAEAAVLLDDILARWPDDEVARRHRDMLREPS